MATIKEKSRKIRDDILDYKLKQLRAMLAAEESESESDRFGAHLSHWAGTSNPINIDAGALRALIGYYENEKATLAKKTEAQA